MCLSLLVLISSKNICLINNNPRNDKKSWMAKLLLGNVNVTNVKNIL